MRQVMESGQWLAEAEVHIQISHGPVMQASVAEIREVGLRDNRFLGHTVQFLETKHPRCLLYHRGEEQDGSQGEQYDWDATFHFQDENNLQKYEIYRHRTEKA